MIAANAGGAWTPIGKGRMEGWREVREDTRKEGRMEGSKGEYKEGRKLGYKEGRMEGSKGGYKEGRKDGGK